MRAALIVGVNYYEHGNPLSGCVNDACRVKSVLELNSDGSVNFECRLITASSNRDSITKTKLREAIEELFALEEDTVLFYFSGHGHIEITGGYLMASSSERGNDGIPLTELLTLANASPASNKIIVLDCCHSGIAGTKPGRELETVLTEGITILTSSTKDQYSLEGNDSGIFTTLFLDALSGSAADLLGNITPGSIYAHIDQSLGAFEQRPLFKTNIRRFVSLRGVFPAIQLNELRMIAVFFPSPGFELKLDPSWEPEMKGRDHGMPLPIEENVRKFIILQKYNRLNLLVPVDEPNMWTTAMNSKLCKLTALGEHYRNLSMKGRLG